MKRLVIVIIATMAFIILGALISDRQLLIIQNDLIISNFFRNMVNSQLSVFFIIIAKIFNPILVIIYSWGFFCILRKDDFYPFKSFCWTVIGGYVFMEIIKLIFQRSRPVDPLKTVAGYSFPSAHTFEITLATLMMVYWLEHSRVRLYRLFELLAILMVFLVILSRLYLQAHYFSDILGGVLLAIAWFEISLIIFPPNSPPKDN
ncbi:phosphatase PAP2 family protein [Liquorilactobacillus sicerae]|uniref:phosphatase PAP2 family protein n=1 Tax=Liquorilactobacillus sicerae TaxID=1416943 RepID=UPI00248116F3|nr:phosphatase PAP2 family protein [Liquorilactobacillus sicerae]